MQASIANDNNISGGDDNDSNAITMVAGYTTLGVFFALAYAFNSSIHVVMSVKEVEEKLKYALNVMGCKFQSYWAGTFALDYLMFVCTIPLLIIFAYITSQSLITMYIWNIACLVLFFGLPFITLAYFIGNFFKVSNTAAKAYPIIQLIVFYMIFLMGWAFASSYK